jgi:hypothetical protein
MQCIFLYFKYTRISYFTIQYSYCECPWSKRMSKGSPMDVYFPQSIVHREASPMRPKARGAGPTRRPARLAGVELPDKDFNSRNRFLKRGFLVFSAIR